MENNGDTTDRASPAPWYHITNKNGPKEFERTPADKTLPAPTGPQVRVRSRTRRVPWKIGFDAGQKPD